MPPKRMRGAEPVEDAAPSPPSDLDQIRDMEEFAALGQYLFMFGVGALKLPDFGREELETALLAPQSALVEQIQLALIKMVMLNPRLVMEQFNEQARKQYLLHKPEANPFKGDDEVVKSFGDMNIFTRIRVLHQLSVWTFTCPNQIREKMGEIDISEELSWRMEPAGYDSKENEYFILDDNRLYRRTAWKEAATVPKKKAQTPRTGRKRRRVLTAVTAESDEVPIKADEGRKWTCVCISPQDWEVFVASLKSSKDEDEKVLYKYLSGAVLPEIRRGEELKQKKLLDLEKERQKQQAVANRKRSSRIDEKMARRKVEEEKAAEARKQEGFLKETQAEERKRDKEREARLTAHERQIKRQNNVREKKLQAYEVGSSSRATSGDESSVNGRRVSARVQTRRSQRSPSVEKEGDWIFDCRCGVHGKKHAGGSTIIACDKCTVWQHLACQNLPPSFTEGDFTCERCRRREAAREISNSSRVTIKLRIGPSTGVPPMDVPRIHDENAPPTVPKTFNQPMKESQAEIINQSRHETQLVSEQSSDRVRKEAKMEDHPEPAPNQNLSALGKLEANGVTNGGGGNSTREGSAQASADFLLLMADPGHGTSDSQQPGNGNASENPSLANGVQKPHLPKSYEDRSQSQPQPSKLVNGTSDAVPGGFVDRLPPPSTFAPLVESPNNTGTSSPGKNDTHAYHENAHVQNMLAGPARSANA